MISFYFYFINSISDLSDVHLFRVVVRGRTCCGFCLKGLGLQSKLNMMVEIQNTALLPPIYPFSPFDEYIANVFYLRIQPPPFQIEMCASLSQIRIN